MLVISMSVTLSTGTALATHDLWKCTQNNTGYFCFFENVNFNRTMTGHSGAYHIGYYCGSFELPLSFWDRTSSWQNKQTGWTNVEVFSWLVYPNYEWLWTMGAYNTESSWVGNPVNDKADWYFNDCAP
jgi:hypothetical protein